MLTNPNPFLRKAEWCRYCFHLRSLNFSHFKVIQALGLKITALRFPWMTSSPYKVLYKSTNRFKSYLGEHTDRQTHRNTHTDKKVGDLISLLFIVGMYDKDIILVVLLHWLSSLRKLPKLLWLNSGCNCGTLCCTHGVNCHTAVVWLPWLLNLTLNGPVVTGAALASTSKVWSSSILKWFKVFD
jgi:hypothetical protein